MNWTTIKFNCADTSQKSKIIYIKAINSFAIFILYRNLVGEGSRLELIIANLHTYDELIQKDIEDLLHFYMENIEFIIENPEVYLNDYFMILKTQKKSDLMGSFSSREHIDAAVQNYLYYINDPKNKIKRSYIFHSQDRKKWSPEQYQKF